MKMVLYIKLYFIYRTNKIEYTKGNHMQAQDLSYKLNNQKIGVTDCNGLDYQVSVEVISLENVYTVPEGAYKVKVDTHTADTLVWGNSEPVDGKVTLSIHDLGDGKVFGVKAHLPIDVRGVKLRLDGLPLGKLLTLTSSDAKITEYGTLIHYPEGWRTLITPLLVFQLENGKYFYLRTLDKSVNNKHFFIKKVDNTMRIDVIQEQDGTSISSTYDVPEVECGMVDDVNTIYARQSETIKQTYHLDEYEHCSVKPVWLDDISLVVTMHMQTFTGYIFHTYEQAYEDVCRLCEMIDGKRILVYLTGWEGRYYYKYGDYTPDERLGGAAALKESVRKMQALGCKVMAMYGINIVNKDLATVRDIIDASELESVSGGRFHRGSVNWEGAHHYDYGGHAQLNIGNPLWQDNLYGQIKETVTEFGFDGVFLDIAAYFNNDRRHRIYEGVVEFCDRLRSIKPDFLVSGEGYYDGLSRTMPLFQSGHTDGQLHYHDRFSDELFTRFSRQFGHLCIGDPSRGSTGVHELGTNTDWRTPLRKSIIPTLSLVEDSFEHGLDGIKLIVEDAKEYARRFLDGNE